MQAIGADANDWDRHFVLMADVDLGGYTGEEFNIIGDFATPFAGVFDGNGHRIYNFTYYSTGTHYIGLFGYVSGPHDSSAIKNLGLIDPNVNGGTGARVGALIGQFNARIDNCYIQGGSVLGREGVGGLAGKGGGVVVNCYTITSVMCTDIESPGRVGGLVGSNHAELRSCYSNCVVEGGAHVGGLAGDNTSQIRNCYATGIVTGYNYATGGLVGTHGGISAGMYNCYSTAVVEGNMLVGGLVGENYKTIANCYAAGSTQGTKWIGGLVGDGTTNLTTDCFWDIETTGQGSSVGGTGKTTAEMQTESTFTDAGWDFINVWNIGENQTYPYFRTHLRGDINKDKTVNFLDLCIIAQQWCNEE